MLLTDTIDKKLADNFSNLKGVMESVSCHNSFVIADNFNGQIEKDEALLIYNKNSNKNRIKLINFAHKFQLQVAKQGS